MEDFYRKAGGARSYEQKERRNWVRPGHFPLAGRTEGFIIFFLVGGMERAHVADYLNGADRKIPACLCFWGTLKLPLGQVLSSGLVTWSSRSDTILGLWFSFYHH